MNVLPAHTFASKDKPEQSPLQLRKRPLHEDDPFFQEGAYEYKAAWIRLEDANAYIPDLNDSDDDTWSEYSHRLTTQRCHLGRCHGELTFSSPAAYEHHYEINHRHICETCGKPFPGEKWLELHIHEVHNIMVKIKRENGEKTYRCFVEGCDRLCSTAAKRRMHLIDKHQYPKQFNFGIVFTGILPFEERLKRRQSELFNLQDQEGKKVHARHQLQSSVLYKDRCGQKSLNTKVDRESGDMDIDPSTTLASQTALRRSSTSSEASTVGSEPLIKGRAIRGAEALPTKKQAFVQYRTPEKTKARQARDRDVTRSVDQAMEVEPSTCATTIGSEGRGVQDRMDTDMDQLQQSMVRLMVPRSVLNKIRHLSTAPSVVPVPGPASAKAASTVTAKRPRKQYKLNWTSEDDALLLDLRLHQNKRWLEIGQALDREPATCMTRFESTLNPVLKEFWTAEKDRSLDLLVSRSKSWPDIALELGVHRLACMERWRQLGLKDLEAEAKTISDQMGTSSGAAATKRRKQREQTKREQEAQDFQEQDNSKSMREMVGSLRAVGQVDKDFDHQGWNALLKDEQRYETHRSWKRKSRLDAFSQLYLMNPGWSAKEETILIQFVLNNGLGQWGRVASEHLGGQFTPEQCRTCWKNLDMPVVALLESKASRQETHQGVSQQHDSVKNGTGEKGQDVSPAAMRAVEKEGGVLLSQESATSKRKKAFIWDKELSVRLQAVIHQAYKSRAINMEEINWLWISTKVHPDATSRICKNHWKFLHPEYNTLDIQSASSNAAVKVWTHEDVRKLEEGIRLVGPRRLTAIRDHFLPHMTKDDITRQWFRISDKATIIGEEEYYRLLGAVEKVVTGAKREVSGTIIDKDPQSQDWTEVERIMGPGSGWKRMPCKRVWESSFQHLIRHTAWSPIEDNTLLRMVKFVGRDDWFTVAKALQMDRTAWQCRLRWCQLLDPVQLEASDLYVDGERYN